MENKEMNVKEQDARVMETAELENVAGGVTRDASPVPNTLIVTPERDSSIPVRLPKHRRV